MLDVRIVAWWRGGFISFNNRLIRPCRQAVPKMESFVGEAFVYFNTLLNLSAKAHRFKYLFSIFLPGGGPPGTPLCALLPATPFCLRRLPSTPQVIMGNTPKPGILSALQKPGARVSGGDGGDDGDEGRPGDRAAFWAWQFALLTSSRRMTPPAKRAKPPHRLDRTGNQDTISVSSNGARWSPDSNNFAFPFLFLFLSAPLVFHLVHFFYCRQFTYTWRIFTQVLRTIFWLYPWRVDQVTFAGSRLPPNLLRMRPSSGRHSCTIALRRPYRRRQ
ncbi:hypothetical protein F4802DRAFT_382862 [Xylaria palmicola]|nr:hypothetical protein F4802DRAFT_382862 [Xylaria palmicola]